MKTKHKRTSHHQVSLNIPDYDTRAEELAEYESNINNNPK